MSNATAQQEKSRAYFRSWYDKHGEERNERRRKQYAENPEVREKAKERARMQRAGSSKGHTRPPTFRMVGGKQIRAYLMSETAAMVGRDLQTIRSWERKGWIPPDTFGEGKRLYTHTQVQLMKMFAEYLMGGSAYASWTREKMIDHIHSNWTK